MKSKFKFTDYITEGVSSANAVKASNLIAQYIAKKTGLTFFKFPGIEQYNNSKNSGFGLRMFSKKGNQSIRFNYKSAGGVGLINLESLHYWNGSDPAPFFVEFDTRVSIIKVLPIIVDMINNKGIKLGATLTPPDDVPLNESDYTLYENESMDSGTMFDGIVSIIELNGPKGALTQSKLYSYNKIAGIRVFDQIVKEYPDLFFKSGTKYDWRGTSADIENIKKDKSKILSDIGAVGVRVSKGSANETYKVDKSVSDLDKNLKTITFKKQLEDLENLVRMTVAGSSNALFVSGSGGVGKTFTTEKILKSLGLRDGAGYFKNTGSSSAAGLYALLFRYKDKIVFFDDSDSTLGDQEARNIVKAATDTKKIRKLVWNKMGKNVADPEEMTDQEILDDGMIPRYFEFTGKIIFISNLSLDKLDPDGALRTRAFIININPTEDEIYEFMGDIVEKMELEDGLSLDLESRKSVIGLLRSGKSKQQPNLRKLSRGLNMLAGSQAAGVNISKADLARMIESYATLTLGFFTAGVVAANTIFSSVC